MAQQKKTKTGKGKPSKGTGKKPSPPAKEESKDAVLLNPQERVAAVRPMWEQKPHEQRLQLLTADLETLQQRAKAVTEKARAQAVLSGGELLDYGMDPPLDVVLDEALRRLSSSETWKIWSFGSQEFYDSESFRNHIQQQHIREELLHLLPKDDPRSTERPAEAALRQRMTDLLQQVQLNHRQAQEDQTGTSGSGGTGSSGGSGGRGGRRGPKTNPDQASSLARDGNIDMITQMLEALEKEHVLLYQSLLQPITQYICDVLPDEMRETNGDAIHFEDLEKLPVDQVAHIAEWLTEKVDALSTRLKAEPREDEDEDDGEAMGDVDLFALTADGAALTVNAKWLQHLEERLLGEDGHPRKAREGEDPHRMGLVLEWVFGSIVSTAEKARDGAKRQLGLRPPSAQQAHKNLVQCLEQQAELEARAKASKDLLNAMLNSRKEADELSKQYDTKSPADQAAPAAGSGDGAEGGAGAPAAAGDATAMPDAIIVKMLAREVLLTTAKLCALDFENMANTRSLHNLKSQIRHGEPELDRLKRELEELKHAPRGLEGTFRTAAEMERHRHQLADAAIEEQLEVQTAFREQGAKLQSLYDKKQRTEYEINKRENEIKQLQGWKATVENLLERFDDLLKQAQMLQELDDARAMSGGSSSSASRMDIDGDVQSAAEEGLLAQGPLAAGVAHMGRTSLLTATHAVQLNKLRQHFHKDVRKQLYVESDDRSFFNRIKDGLKSVEAQLEEGRVAVQHLELFLLNVACDDPGTVIGSQLLLPLLQDRLDCAALAFKAERAKMAEDEIIAMEEERRQRQEEEKRRRLEQLEVLRQQAPLDSIKGTVTALGASVELSQVFGGPAAGAPYHLRSVVCYFGHHYQTFVLSEELQQWLLFDDNVIQVVGDWHQVKQTMVGNRLQPSLLFYESADAAA
eukprot:gene13475-13601_t